MASGANDTTGSRAIAVQTLRILAACALSTGGAWAIGLKEGYWALITAIVVLQPALADTVAASRNRVIGTVIGAAAGLIVLFGIQHGLPRVWLFWGALVPLAALTAARPSLRLCCVTLVIIVLLPATDAPFVRAFDRIFAILLGVAASIVVAIPK
jgi:uncharacterized membrane protein YccC